MGRIRQIAAAGDDGANVGNHSWMSQREDLNDEKVLMFDMH